MNYTLPSSMRFACLAAALALCFSARAQVASPSPVKRYFLQDFDVECREMPGDPLQRTVMAIPKSNKMSIKPIRPAVIVLATRPEEMLGFDPSDGTTYPAFARIPIMADLVKRGYVCISAPMDFGGDGSSALSCIRNLADILAHDARVDANTIGIVGHARGGWIAVRAGIAYPRAKAVMASAPEPCEEIPAEMRDRILVVPPQKGMAMPSRYALDHGYDFLDRRLFASMEPEITPPASQPGAEIKWVREICRQTNRQIGWPTVCRRRNGEILAVFSGDRDSHVCPFGKVQMVRSHDNGETWSEPETIVDDLLDDRDAGLIELDNGELLLFYFNSIAFSFDTWNVNHEKYRRHYDKLPKELVKERLGYFSRRSSDGGRTWEAPVRMYVSTPHGGIQLRDGRVMAVGRHWAAEGNATEEDAARRGNRNELAVEVSEDRGRSWKVLASLPTQSGFDINLMHEPHFIERADGTLVVLCNFMSGDRHLVQSESADGGRTWSEFRITALDGYPSHLTHLTDGRILVSYACRKRGREGEYAAVSADGGKTWDAVGEILLARALSTDIGYPSTVALPGGDLLTVYYQSPRHFRLPSLMATKWRLSK